MFEKLKDVAARYEQINEKLMDPTVVSDNNQYKTLMKEHKNLTPIVEKYREYEKAEAVYQAVLRTFGGHASTFGKMSKMYLAWRKKQAAEDNALRALQTDPEQPDALEVIEALGKH